MLAGNVVSAAIRQAQLRSQIEITRADARTSAAGACSITEQRYQAGGVSQYDVRQPANRRGADPGALLPPLELQLDVSEPSTGSADGQNSRGSPCRVHPPRPPAPSRGAAC